VSSSCYPCSRFVLHRDMTVAGVDRAIHAFHADFVGC